MPLSPEQFNSLREQGLSVDQITNFEKGKTPQDISVGDVSSGLEKTPMITPMGAIPRSVPSKTLDFANKALNFLSDLATKKVYSPIARNLTNNPDTKAKLSALESSKDTAFPSDVLQTVFPQLKEASKVPYIGPMGMVPNVALRTAVDVAGDPASYLTFGEKTALGRLAETVSEARLAKMPIKLDSDLAKQIAEHMNAAKPSPQVIKQFVKDNSDVGKTFSEQVMKGQRSLASFQVPGSERSFPLPGMTGKVAGTVVKPLSMMRRGALGTKIEQSIRELLSTSSGNPDFDMVYGNYKDLLYHKFGLQVEEGKVLNDKLNEISRATGTPRDVINQQVNDIGEQISRQLNPKAKIYPKDIHDSILAHYQDKLVDAQVGLKNSHSGYQKAVTAGNQPLADQFQKAIDLHAKDVVDYNSEINKMTGKYAPPPPVNPEVDKIANQLRLKNAQQLFDQETSGIRSVKLLADREYVPHAITMEARDAAAKVNKANGVLPFKGAPREMSENLANNMRRQFTEVNPRTIDAWESSGLVTPREAKDIRSTKQNLVRTVTDNFGNKSKIKVKTGLDKLDQLLNSKKITDSQFNDAVHTLSIREVNNLSAAGKLRNTFGDYTGPIFHTDPVMSSTIRGINGAKATTAAEFFNELKSRKIALPEVPNAPGMPLPPANWVKSSVSELDGYKVPPEVARVLNRFNQFQIVPEELNKVLKTYDKFHSTMKAWTLGIFPAYHTKNMVGNFFNNYLAGLTNPDMYRQALAVRLGKKVNFKDIFGNMWDSAKILEEAKRRGVVGKGWFGGDIARTMEQRLEGGKWITLSNRNKILQAGQKVGKEIEDNARMAHFIDRLRKGDTAEQAAMSVKKFLFDYGDLSQTERNVLNRLFFFYTWTRKNIPLQLHSLVTNPSKFALPFKIKHNIEANVPQGDERFLPEYVKENFPTRIRYNSKTKTYEYFLLNNWLPAADLLKLSHLHDVGLNMLAPLFKEGLQQAENLDIYRKQPISNFPGEKETLLGLKVNKKLSHALKTIRLLNEIDKMTAPDADFYHKVLGFTTGNNYTYDIPKAKLQNKSRVDNDLDVLKKALLKAQAKKDKVTAFQIEQKIRSKMQEYQGK